MRGAWSGPRVRARGGDPAVARRCHGNGRKDERVRPTLSVSSPSAWPLIAFSLSQPNAGW